MECFKDYLNESSLSRIYRQTRKHDYGIITAFRKTDSCDHGKPYTKNQNLQRNKSLLAKLRAKSYSVTKIKGSYIENYGTKNAREVGENSFLVVDILRRGDLKNTLMKLGQEFDQDCILFGEAGKDGVLISTNKCPDGYPGKGKIGVHDKQGGAVFGKSGQFMSRVKGRPFVFSEDVIIESYGLLKYPTELRGVVYLSQKDWQDIEL